MKRLGCDYKSLFRAAVLFLLVEIVAYRVFSGGVGFYHDGWVFLGKVLRGKTLLGAVEIFAQGGFWTRPVQILQIPLFYWMAQDAPIVGQMLLASLEVAEAFLLYLFVRRLTGRERLALLASVFMLVHPSRPIVHAWLSNASQLVAHVMVLGSLLFHERWVRTRDRSSLFLGQAAYILSVLCYESTAFLPLMLVGALLARALLEKRTWREALTGAIQSSIPYLGSFCIVILWQWVGAGYFFDNPNPKTVHLSFSHFTRVFFVGFECIVNRPLHLALRSFAPAMRDVGFWAIFGLAVFSVVAVYSIDSEEEAGDGRSRLWILLGAIVPGYVGAYLPYALSGNYVPMLYGLMSRTNGAGVWIAGFLLAGLFELCPRRWPRAIPRVLAAVLIMSFCWTDWLYYRAYGRSWALQLDILEKTQKHVASLEGPATIILTGAPRYVEDAVVFDAPYDFSSALRIFSKRQDLKGFMVSPRLTFKPDAVYEEINNGKVIVIPYKDLFLYDYSSDSFTSLGGPPASEP